MKNTNMNNMMMHPQVVRNILVGETMAQNPPPVEPDKPGILFPNRNEGCPPLQISFGQLSTGLVLLGGTGSGKSNVYKFMIDQILDQMHAGSISLLFDPKGEFTEQIQNADKKNRVVILSSDPADQELSSHWNIYEELICAGVEEGELMARAFGKSLFAEQIKSSQPFFGYAPADVFSLILIHHLRSARATGDYSQLNNAELVRFINRLRTANQLHDLIDQHPDFHYVTTYIGERGQGMSGQALGVLGTLHSMVNSTFIGPFRQAGKPFSMARLFRDRNLYPHGTVVILKYTVKHKEALERILSLVVDQFIKEGLSTRDDAGDTFLILDELAMLPNIQMLPSALNFGRSRGMKTICGIQSTAQLRKDEAGALMAGFSSCLGFRCFDHESREYLAQRFGETFEDLGYAGKAVSHASHLIRDCDIRNLTKGIAYADFPDQPPFQFQFSKFEA